MYRNIMIRIFNKKLTELTNNEFRKGGKNSVTLYSEIAIVWQHAGVNFAVTYVCQKILPGLQNIFLSSNFFVKNDIFY